MLGIADPVLALALDDALHQRLIAHERGEASRRESGPRGGIAPGLVYEDPAALLAQARREGRVH